MKYSLILILILSFQAQALEFFSSEDIIEINLAYDITKLQKDKELLRKEGLAGTLTFEGREFSVEIFSRGRGSFRCQQPQIKIKWNKKEIKETIFEGMKKSKLFTAGGCLENRTEVHQDKRILSNYLMYKLYEGVSQNHFKTRLLRINYTDTSGLIKDYTQLSFILESKKNLMKRTGLSYVEEEELALLKERLPALVESNTLERVNAFELMISNYDYGVPGFYSHISDQITYFEKNVKMFRNKKGVIIPFIYDFDFSRFNFYGNRCSINYRFFWEQSDRSCTLESIADNLELDLDKFKFRDDFLKNRELLVRELEAWVIKYDEVFTSFGDEYQRGLTLFVEVLIGE